MAKHARPHILIVGGGYVGMYTALRLQRKLHEGEATITVVEPNSYMTYQPFLPEAGAGNLEPRHVVVPLRRVLKKCRILNGMVTKIDHGQRIAQVQPIEGPEQTLSYDILVMCPGSIARTLPIPGLAENGIGFKQIEEAIALRNHVLGQMDIAATTKDEKIRRRALTFVFIGGGFAGIEAIAELEDMARDACKIYPNISPEDMRWVMVEGSGRILPEVRPALGEYTVRELEKRGIQVKLNTFLESCVNRRVQLSDGTKMVASTIVWTAGVKPNPVVQKFGVPLGERGHVKADPTLRVEGFANVWAAGDGAQVPDLANPGKWCSPSAQHAVRQAKQLADNVVATVRGFEPREYKHKHVGSVASLGLHKGVADVYNIRLRGWPAWFMHRTYHMSRVPTFNRKIRVIADWTLALFFRREAVGLGSIERPRDEFAEAAGDQRKAA
jgi:NADH:ubiquinone reductase (H+-translocating)